MDKDPSGLTDRFGARLGPEPAGDRLRATTPANGRPMVLRNDDRVAIVGGGPAGSFFALHLLREGRRLGRRLDVLIIEKQDLAEACPGGTRSRGCNFCAGGISPRLHEVLAEHGLTVPEDIIRGHIDYVWIHGLWKNFRLRVPEHMRMYSVFRGSLPSRRGDRVGGFDDFLLGEAIKEGARTLRGEARSVTYDPSGMPVLTVGTPSGEQVAVEAAFVAIACGINAGCGIDRGEDGLIASVRRMNPAFVPGGSRKAFIFEIEVGEDYLTRNMHREVHFIEYGSKRLVLEHIALLPKGDFLTVTVIGKGIDEAAFPRDSQRVMHEFLALPQINRILPGIETAPVACVCFPRMATTTAGSPFGDRFALIGDAVGSRLNKDGLFSAHVTASRLARTVLHDGVDERGLARGYGKTVDWLRADNRYGRIVFGASRMAFTKPVVSRIFYQAFATEFKVRDERSRPLAAVLWKIASGTSDYRDVLREMCSFRLLQSLLIGTVVTVRNLAIEWLLGLRWGEYGRYPTVVLKEKRAALKMFLASRLGMALDGSPDFERMYVIKIRGSRQKIMEQLARFGHRHPSFLDLRLIEVRHIQGTPNQPGSAIRYRMPLVGLATDLHLTHRPGPDTLLYQVDERFADHGKLIFDVAPTQDGNSRLSIYAAFDYKRGRSFAGRLLWGAGRLVFPEFVHDVVWNHALCAIKQQVEQGHRSEPVAGRPAALVR